MTANLPIVVVEVGEDAEVQVVAYVDDRHVLHTEILDLGPTPTWPSPVEAADIVAAAVREAWLRQHEYYSGEKVDR